MPRVVSVTRLMLLLMLLLLDDVDSLNEGGSRAQHVMPLEVEEEEEMGVMRTLLLLLLLLLLLASHVAANADPSAHTT